VLDAIVNGRKKMDEKMRILLVEDDEAALKLAKLILEGEGYVVHTAGDGVTALELLNREPYDMLLMDIDLPRMNGFQVCQRVRTDILYGHMPIILLTGSREVDTITTALGFGSDDYIHKPYRKAELVARVKRVIERTKTILDANPLTKMPGNLAISEEIEKRINSEQLFSVLYIDICKFKAFNDKYGFIRGDSVIKLTARIILETIQESGHNDEFAGHIGGDDFVLVTVPERAVNYC
jgi:DNA-binding response OmpR family regulator